MAFTEIAYFGSCRLNSYVHVLNTVEYLSATWEIGNYILQVWDFALMKYIWTSMGQNGFENVSNLYLEIRSETIKMIVPAHNLSPEHINERKKTQQGNVCSLQIREIP